MELQDPHPGEEIRICSDQIQSQLITPLINQLRDYLQDLQDHNLQLLFHQGLEMVHPQSTYLNNQKISLKIDHSQEEQCGNLHLEIKNG